MGRMLMKHCPVDVAVGGIPIGVTSYGTNWFMYILTLERMKQTQTGIGIWQEVHGS